MRKPNQSKVMKCDLCGKETESYAASDYSYLCLDCFNACDENSGITVDKTEWTIVS